ncbi:helix-turn-helix domain-containing protein [soil metagenome]
MQSGTLRSRAKAERRTALVNAAIALFASRGFTDTPLEDIGSAAGVSGPAVYRHFASKQAVLAAILVEQSTDLLDGGRAVLAQDLSTAETIGALVDFHITFALGRAEIIRIQDHDLDKLSESDRHAVRAAQRAYVEIWVETLAGVHPDDSAAARRTRAHAAFGLMNSTPYSAGRGPHTRRIIERMTVAALYAPLDP